MQKSDTIALLAAALVKAQPQFKTAKMSSVNPFFKSKYADLGEVWEAVQEALEANGLTVSQFPDAIGQEPALTTILLHESGEWLAATYPLMVTDKESTPQGYGSALTYARRYGLSAVLGVIADVDDDAPAAAPIQQTKTEQPPETTGAAKKPTLGEWVSEAKASFQAAKIPDTLTVWLQDNHDRMMVLKETNPSIYNTLSVELQNRKAELERG
jgi:hypothetical protein